MSGAQQLVLDTIQQNPVSRGLAIVVANQHSRVFPKRILHGAKKDLEATGQVFKALHYAVIQLLDVPKSIVLDVISAVVQFFPACDDLRYKRIVFCFAGHGDENMCIHTGDGEISVHNDIMWPLLPVKCPRLRHIPKLFFIDACRGENVDRPVPRGGGVSDHDFVYSRVSGMANYLLVQSTLPTKEAYENHGGYWTQAFLAELQKPSNLGRDIGYILIEVNRHVNAMFNIPIVLNMANYDCIQQAITENTLLDHVFFLDEAQLFGGIKLVHGCMYINLITK